MTGKRFIYCEEENGEFPFPYIKNTDGKSIISLYECCDLMNDLHEENEMRKEHQRTLEDKIRRLKDRVKTFEKHYSLNDIERLRGD